MNTAIRADDIADLADFQRVGPILKRFLHLPRSEPAQIPILLMRGAIRMDLGELCKFLGRAVDFCLVTFEYFYRFLL